MASSTLTAAVGISKWMGLHIVTVVTQTGPITSQACGHACNAQCFSPELAASHSQHPPGVATTAVQVPMCDPAHSTPNTQLHPLPCLAEPNLKGRVCFQLNCCWPVPRVNTAIQ
jgi:hypothetical protein